MTPASSHRPTHDAALAGGRVLIVGAGGLGTPVAEVLAAVGVGTLGLVDPDVVDVSNLHRQLLYDSGDAGRPKVEVATARLRARAPGIVVRTWCQRFEPGRSAILGAFDL